MIFVVEDDEFIRDGLEHLLCAEGYEVESFAGVEGCLERLKTNRPDLLILDVLLPDGNGFELCEKIRQKSSSPILFLTCCDEEFQIVRGFESGADDYVTKPFRVKELLLRIKALLRRSKQPEEDVIEEDNGILLDNTHRQISINGRGIGVTPTEFILFEMLYRKKGQVVSREVMLHKVWDLQEDYIDENTLNVHMSSLRKKLGDYRGSIETIRGVGYRFIKDGEKMEK